jgi:hypothetical protein
VRRLRCGLFLLGLACADGGAAWSSLQPRAQPQGLAEGVSHAPPGRAHAPLGPLGAAGFPDLRHDMPRLALPLGLRLHVALAFRDDLAGDIWVYLHVTHLLSVPLMDGCPAAAGQLE